MSEDVTEKAKETVEAARERVAEIAGEASERLDEMKRQAERVSERVRRGAERATKVARDRYETTVQGLRHGYDKARKDFSHLSGEVNAYVRDNPGKSIAIAVGVGFLIGLLLGGRRRGRD